MLGPPRHLNTLSSAHAMLGWEEEILPLQEVDELLLLQCNRLAFELNMDSRNDMSLESKVASKHLSMLSYFSSFSSLGTLEAQGKNKG